MRLCLKESHEEAPAVGLSLEVVYHLLHVVCDELWLVQCAVSVHDVQLVGDGFDYSEGGRGARVVDFELELGDNGLGGSHAD